MKPTWDGEALGLFDEMLHKQMVKGCLGLTILAITLFPAFAFLDFILYPEKIHLLWPVRLGTTVFFALTWLVQLKINIKRPFALAFTLLSLSAVSITAMCMMVGGFDSPYYAGVNLVVLAGVVVLPLGPQKMSLIVLTVIGIYILGGSLVDNLDNDKIGPLVGNLYFMVSTGVVVVTAAHLKYLGQVESFDRLIQLKRSGEILKFELQSEQGNVESLVREITLRKSELEKALLVAQSAQTEAQAALNLREEFISLASHELNTPLISLTLQTQVAKHKVKEGNEISKEVVEKLIKTYDYQLQRLTKIVSDMLDVTKIDLKKFELIKSEVDLDQVMRELLEKTSEKFQKEGCLVTYNSSGAVVGDWDQFRLEQVILNLLSNAMKYGARKPVEIKLYRDDLFTYLTVKDHGIGISQEAQKRIFICFERAVHSSEFTGLGLGLYISKQIVEAHGGEISVESSSGAGAKFEVKLPLR